MKINIKTMKLDTNIVNKTNTIYIHNIPFLTKKANNSYNYYFFQFNLATIKQKQLTKSMWSFLKNF